MTSRKCQGDDYLYKNKYKDGRLNVSGVKIAKYRKQMMPKVSQRALADMLQLQGIDLDKNSIQRMESGEIFITDIELKALAKILNTTTDDLLTD